MKVLREVDTELWRVVLVDYGMGYRGRIIAAYSDVSTDNEVRGTLELLSVGEFIWKGVWAMNYPDDPELSVVTEDLIRLGVQLLDGE